MIGAPGTILSNRKAKPHLPGSVIDVFEHVVFSRPYKRLHTRQFYAHAHTQSHVSLQGARSQDEALCRRQNDFCVNEVPNFSLRCLKMITFNSLSRVRLISTSRQNLAFRSLIIPLSKPHTSFRSVWFNGLFGFSPCKRTCVQGSRLSFRVSAKKERCSQVLMTGTGRCFNFDLMNQCLWILSSYLYL